MNLNWNLTRNKVILNDYDKYSIKKLPADILRKGVYKKCLFRTNSKMVYKSKSKEGLILYEVFVNFVVPIPIQFWAMSFYDFEEIYPEGDDFGYRAWTYTDKKNALEHYITLV